MSSRSQWVVSKTEAVSDHAVVTSNYPHATEAGVEMLKRGGNAADAAVAAGFAIGVVEPFNSGVGGVATLVYYDARTRRTTVVDGTSTLPRAIRPDSFELLDATQRSGMYGWRAVKDDANNNGYRAPIVPGTPACLCEALARFGRLSREDVLAPAIRLAEDGYDLDWYVVLAMAAHQDRLLRFPESRRTFFKPDGACYRPPMLGMEADRFRQPDLARTLRLIARHGAEVVYRGEIAHRIAEDVAANGGFISEADLADYQVRIWEPGLIGEYRGCQTVQAPENSGALTVLEALNILEGFDLAALGHNSAAALHLVAEALRRAFLDRFRHMGDPAFFPIPLDGLVSKAYAAQRRQEIDPRQATPNATAGDPWPFATATKTPAAATPPRSGPGAGESMTTHLTAVDAEGNVASLTSTLGQIFGCGVVVRGTGVTLNNGVTWFDPEPGSVNSIAPGKRILWAGAPTIILRDGKPFFAVGAPGARKVLSAILQSILNVVDFGMGPQAAVSAPRIHCEGRETLADARLGEDVIDGLRQLGHAVTVREETFSSSYFARPNGILIDPATGQRRGGVNQFKPALAIGL